MLELKNLDATPSVKGGRKVRWAVPSAVLTIVLPVILFAADVYAVSTLPPRGECDFVGALLILVLVCDGVLFFFYWVRGLAFCYLDALANGTISGILWPDDEGMFSTGGAWALFGAGAYIVKVFGGALMVPVVFGRGMECSAGATQWYFVARFGTILVVYLALFCRAVCPCVRACLGESVRLFAAGCQIPREDDVV